MKKTTFMLTMLIAASFAFAGETDERTGEILSFKAGGKEFAIPSPDGEMIECGAECRALVEFMTPENNRLIAAFLVVRDQSEGGRQP